MKRALPKGAATRITSRPTAGTALAPLTPTPTSPVAGAIGAATPAKFTSWIPVGKGTKTIAFNKSGEKRLFDYGRDVVDGDVEYDWQGVQAAIRRELSIPEGVSIRDLAKSYYGQVSEAAKTATGKTVTAPAVSAAVTPTAKEPVLPKTPTVTPVPEVPKAKVSLADLVKREEEILHEREAEYADLMARRYTYGDKSVDAKIREIEDYRNKRLDELKNEIEKHSTEELLSAVSASTQERYYRGEDIGRTERGQRSVIGEVLDERNPNIKPPERIPEEGLWKVPQSEAMEIMDPTWVFSDDPRVGAGLRAAHRDIVKKAVAEGKPVPPEVLRDYPELARLSTGGKTKPTPRKWHFAKAVEAPARKWRFAEPTQAGRKWRFTEPVERGAIEQPAKPPLATGGRAVAKTERGTAVQTQYAIVDAGDLISSHDVTLRADPRYPVQLQPRERGRAASEEQITGMVARLEPEFLGESPKASEGAPIVGPDLIVESGNARTIALKRAYGAGHYSAERYRTWLMQNAGRFGLDANAIQQAKAPVLVRIRQTPVDRIRFVQEANESAVAAMSATEQARLDAQKLTGGLMNLFRASDTGEINIAANRDFVREFMSQVVGPAERARYMMPDGSISQEGVIRIRNAVFAKAYGDTGVLSRLAESPDNNVRNITNAMLIAAPRMAKLNESIAQGKRYNLDVSPEIAEAVGKLSALRESGQSIESYMKQIPLIPDMSPLAKDVLETMGNYSRSAKRLSEVFLAYADLVDAAGDPRQLDLMGLNQVPTKEDMWDSAVESARRKEVTGYGAQQSTLFQEQPVRGGPVGTVPGEPGQVAGRSATAGAGIGQGYPSTAPQVPARKPGGILGIVAPVTFGPGLFTDIDKVTAMKGSLLRDEMALMPPALREAVRNIDTAAAIANQKVRLLLAQYKVQDTGALPPQARPQYQQLSEHLENLRRQREALKPQVLQALDDGGKLGSVILREIEAEQKPESMQLMLSDVLEEFGEAWQPGLPNLTPPKQASPFAPTQGYVWRSPVSGRELYIPPVPEPTNAVDAMLQKQPNLYLVGFGAMRDVLGEQVVGPWRSASRQYRAFVSDYEQVLNEAFRGLGDKPQARERVGLMLEGKMPLQGIEGRAALILRQSFFGEKPGEGLHGEFEIDPKRFLEDYLPRIRAAGSVEGAFPGGVPDELKFFAEYERTGNLMARETDSLTICLQYLRAGAKKKFFDPVIQQVKPYVDAMHPDRRWVYEQFVNSVLGKPIMEERLCNGLVKAIANPILRLWGKEITGRPSQTISAFVADLGYQSTIGLNVFSAVKNLTQQLLTVAHLSEKNPAEGMRWWVAARAAGKSQMGQTLLKYNWVAQDRQYLEGLDIQYRLMERVMGPMREIGYKMFEAADRDNVNNAYLAATLKALSDGKSVDEAIRYGNQVAADTQYLYGLDSPLLWKGPLGRLFGMLSSWPVNFMRLLYQQGTSSTKIRVLYTLAALVLGSRILRKLTGLSFKSIEPQEQLKAWAPLAWLRGDFPPPIQTLRSAWNLVRAYMDGDSTAIDEAADDFKRQLMNFVPWYTQLNRLGEFIDTATNEWKVYDARGRLRYETTPGEAFRGIFGTTVEKEAGWQQSVEVAAQKVEYQKLRQRAVDAYFRGDMDTFRRLNGELLRKYGKMIRGSELRELRKTREQPALERQRQGLPAGLR
ncbi:MAG: hypothetical protein ACM3X4_01580 [Ignavibacteriales bacterium]